MARFLNSIWFFAFALTLWLGVQTAMMNRFSIFPLDKFLPLMLAVGILYGSKFGFFAVTALALSEYLSTRMFFRGKAVIAYVIFALAAATIWVSWRSSSMAPGPAARLLSMDVWIVLGPAVAAVFLAYLARSISRNLLT